jgi:uncharacterized damage-inducible protein DinB
MTVKDLQRRFAYGYWANARLLAVVSQLTPEQFTREAAGSYGSVRNTLVHMLSAEWGWLDRCGGPPPARGAALKADDFPTLDSIVSRWTNVESNVRAFLATLEDDDLRRVIEFTLPQTGTRAASVGDLLEHAANHGVHHRGQIALLLRVLGCAPGNVDLLFYDAETRGVGA